MNFSTIYNGFKFELMERKATFDGVEFTSITDPKTLYNIMQRSTSINKFAYMMPNKLPDVMCVSELPSFLKEDSANMKEYDNDNIIFRMLFHDEVDLITGKMKEEYNYILLYGIGKQYVLYDCHDELLLMLDLNEMNNMSEDMKNMKVALSLMLFVKDKEISEEGEKKINYIRLQ